MSVLLHPCLLSLARIAGSAFLAVASQPPPAPSAAANLAGELELGRKLYGIHCAECHGETGDGYGLRQDITYARPRSFHLGRFKLATTDNRVPSDADLIRTIRRGIALVGMPNWGHLPEEEIAAVARYVRSIGVGSIREELARQVARGRLGVSQAAELMVARTVPGEPIEVPPEPTWTPQRREAARRLYLDSCAPCHGPEGDAPPGAVKVDLEGNHLLPTSLRQGLFKGGAEGEELYVRLLMGLDGTAMPGYDGVFDGDQLWDLVHYVQSLSQPPGWSPRALEGSDKRPPHEAQVKAEVDSRGEGRVALIAEYERFFADASNEIEEAEDAEIGAEAMDPFAGWPEGTTWEEEPPDASGPGVLVYLGLLFLGLSVIAFVAWARSGSR